MRSLKDLELTGRRVFCRVDFNVPLDSSGAITDDTRIRAALPTIRYILAEGGQLVLASHLGRPKGAVVPAMSLEPAAMRLAELLEGGEVILTDDCIGAGARKVVGDLRDGQVAVLENLRFHAGEKSNDEAFAKELALLCDVYVGDAFGVSHRAHASVEALPRMIGERAPGFLMEKELASLGALLNDVKRPYVAVLGGAKVSDKINVLEALLTKVDAIVIGGAMANTFLAARGRDMQASLVEDDKLPLARSILGRADVAEIDILLPTDVLVGKSLQATSGTQRAVTALETDEMALDIGPESAATFAERIRKANSVFWNGPMGLFENPAFSEGTLAIASAMAKCPGFTVVGGGDSVAAIQQAGRASGFDHVSTGGGASLELLEGAKLPGVEALR